MQIEQLENSNNNRTELLPQIAERIFAVCRLDPMFCKNSELDKLEEELEKIQTKISKQKQLLERSYEIEKELTLRLQNITDDNENKQAELLEKIGE